jgi:hypothetical protein
MIGLGSGMALASLALSASAQAPADEGRATVPGTWIDLAEHGVRADGVTDDHAAIQRVFDEVVPATGAVVRFPPGVCRCSGRIVSRGRPLAVVGAGAGNSVVLFTGTDPDSVGFLFDQQRFPNTLRVCDLGLWTDGQEAGDALTVAYTPQDCMSMRVTERVTIQNVSIVGQDIARHGFRNGVVLRYVNSPLLSNVSVSGRQPRAGMQNRTRTECCFKLVAGAVGESMPVQARLLTCSGYNARYGVNLIGAHEGLVVYAGNFVECAVGIAQNCGPEPGLFPEPEPLPDGGTRPGVWITDTHCNVFVAGIYLQKVVQVFVKDCLIYKAPDAVEDCTAVRLSRCADVHVRNSMFVSHSRRGRFEGVCAENGTVRCRVSDNTMEWCDTAVRLGPGTGGIHVWDNVVQGGGEGALVDQGRGNRFRALGADAWESIGPTE